jgi:hypothetical protein
MHLTNNAVPLHKHHVTKLKCEIPGKVPHFINLGGLWRWLVTSNFSYFFYEEVNLLRARWIRRWLISSIGLDMVSNINILSLLRKETRSLNRKQLQDPRSHYLNLHSLKNSRSWYYRDYINIVTTYTVTSIVAIYISTSTVAIYFVTRVIRLP